MKKQWLAMGCIVAAVLTGCNREDDAGASFGYDRHFMKMAAYANRNSSEIGVLVLARSSDSTILSVAAAEKADHEIAYNELSDLADTYPQSIPVAPDAKHVELRQKLITYSGRSFDSVYIHAQVADHQDAIRLFQDELENGSDPAVRAYASKYLPKLQEHLVVVQTVAAGY